MNYNDLTTEKTNKNSRHLDRMTTREIVRVINDEDKTVPFAVERELDDISRAIDLIADRLRNGGRLIYIGAGTSGRLGIIDATECPPTYGVSPELIQGVIAGGHPAMFRSSEGMEDVAEDAAADLDAVGFSDKDVCMAISASGSAAYCRGALEYAHSLGAATVALSCNKNGAMNPLADVAIAVVVGPEVVSGSTRMKAGTAQKLVLNMISTGAMVKFGKVYQNLMVDMQATNVKLVDRACRMVVEATGIARAQAETLLKQTDYDVKPAILMALTGLDAAAAREKLAAHQGFLRAALEH